MFTEDDFIPISALQHYQYCPRQCALIHVEDAWKDNVFTVRGEILHEKVDSNEDERRGTVNIVRSLRIHSARLGIVGRCDVVEFRSKASSDELKEIVPVEYKSGEPKDDLCDRIQLCAQALCLEEMIKHPVCKGEFFYAKIRRRVAVDLDEALRSETERVIAAVHAMIVSRTTPSAEYSAKCRHCSLEDACLPKASNQRGLRKYMDALYQP